MEEIPQNIKQETVKSKEQYGEVPSKFFDFLKDMSGNMIGGATLGSVLDGVLSEDGKYKLNFEYMNNKDISSMKALFLEMYFDSGKVAGNSSLFVKRVINWNPQ